jgi:5-(carboxyamino)imidazole ribonucleotide mutase
MSTNKKIALVLGSDSDIPIAESAVATLKKLALEYDVRILSAHRTPHELAGFAQNARKNGFAVIIAFAGMAAHLAGAIAAQTTLPVIAVPCASGAQGGLDALLSCVQMPPGVPVATVAINGGINAAILAAQITGVHDEKTAAALMAKKKEQQQSVLEKDKKNPLRDKPGGGEGRGIIQTRKTGSGSSPVYNCPRLFSVIAAKSSANADSPAPASPCRSATKSDFS